MPYGRSNKQLFFADNIKTVGIEGISASFNTPTSTLEIIIPALGEHMILNALAAIAVAQHLKLSTLEIKEGFKLYKPTKMRMDLQCVNDIHVINDTYNASPDSMLAALGVLETIPNMKRRIAILGDMFEMGEHAPALHREVGESIGEKQQIDLLITVGEMSQHIIEGAIETGFSRHKTIHFQKQEDLLPKLGDLINPGDLVLVKASRGMALEKTVDEIGKVK